jgi:8-oxo-dGTP diphosphatase
MMLNVRVYGLLINDKNQILVSDELIKEKKYTKFPGGGLEFGEGTIDCVQREFIEEMNLKIEVVDHFYTTDFFQRSSFNTTHQIIAIYYLVKALEPINVAIKNKPFDFDEQQLQLYKKQHQIESFRFIDHFNFSEATVTLPIDKKVATLLQLKMGMQKQTHF